jgi:hypothetical protein
VPPVRIAFVDTLYPAFTAAHYAARPGLEQRSYEEQRSTLLERSFGTSDAYSVGLRALGHEATDLLVNVMPLQRTWAREHGLRLTPSLMGVLPGRVRARLGAGDREPRRIARAQIDDFGADVIYCQDLSFFTAGDLRELHAEGRLVVGQIASAPPGEDRLRAFDLILTSFPHYVDRFRALGTDSEYFAIGFDARVLDRLRAIDVEPDADAAGREGAVFVGGVDPRVHGAGVARWERVLAEVPFEVHGYGGDQLPAGSPLRRAWRGEAWGLDMYAVLARAGIALNRHIGAAEGFANNMRLFEATGVGALLLTESAPNLVELFEPDIEVVTYGSDAELVERLRHFLGDPDARREIATAGQRRTLADHTYQTRMAQLSGILTSRRHG